MPQKLQKGDYVELIADADFRPYAMVRKGARGKVVRACGDEVDIRMDKTYPGLAKFDNCIWITSLVAGEVQFKHVERKVSLRVSYALAAAIACFIIGAAFMEVSEALVIGPNVTTATFEWLWDALND